MKKGRLQFVNGIFVPVESPTALAKRKKAEQAALLAREKDPKLMSQDGRRKKRERNISKKRMNAIQTKHIGLYYLLRAIDVVEAN